MNSLLLHLHEKRLFDGCLVYNWPVTSLDEKFWIMKESSHACKITSSSSKTSWSIWSFSVTFFFVIFVISVVVIVILFFVFLAGINQAVFIQFSRKISRNMKEESETATHFFSECIVNLKQLKQFLVYGACSTLFYS